MPGALVMCDGGPASLKAIHYAGLPGNLLRRRALNEQLVIVHMYDKPTSPAAGATSAPGNSNTITTAAANASAAGMASNAMLDSLNNKPSTPRPGSYEPGEGNDGGNGTGGEQMPVTSVVQTVVQTIQEDKQLRDTLLYLLETAVIPPPEVENKAGAGGKASSTDVSAKSSARTASAGRPPRASSQGRGAPHAAGATRLNASPAAHHTTTTANASVVEEAEESGESGNNASAAVVPHRVQSIVSYAKDRALHHNISAVLLGVGPGKAADGKSLRLGAVARHVLRQLPAQQLVVYCMKADGATLRLSTAQVRLVVVVQVGAAYVEEPRTTASSVKDGATGADHSRTSSLRDLSQPSSLLERTQAGGGANTSNTNNASMRTNASSVKPEAMEETKVDYMAAGEAAVQYALRCRRVASKDCVSVVLVAEQQVSEAELQSYRDHFATLLQNNTNNSEQQQEGEGDDEDDEAGGEVKMAEQNESEAAATTTTTTVTAAEGTSSGTAAKTNNTGSTSSNWPPLSVCQLKATKHIAQATLTNSVTQVHKFLQQHKSDFYVFADCTTPPLQQALLTSVKPHCIVVPRPRKPCRE